MHVEERSASIGSMCIQKAIKLHSHGKGLIGRDPGCQHCLRTYLSVVTQTGLNMNALEAFPPLFPSFLLHLFVFHKIYSTLPSSICHFLKSCHSFFPHLVALLLVSPANVICLFHSVSTCILLSSILFYMLLPSIHRSIMLHPPPSLLPPSFPHSELSNEFMKWAGEMREIAILMVWHEALSQRLW